MGRQLTGARFGAIVRSSRISAERRGHGAGERPSRLNPTWLVLTLGCLALAHCGWPGREAGYSPRVVEEGEPVPKGGGSYRVGRPYNVNGRTYFPREEPNYRIEGMASWYGPDFHGRLTANGEVYDMHSISAAHTTMPLPSYARVTNLDNGRSVIVRVNDRGPYRRDRVIDLSIGTAKLLDFYSRGLARVRVEYVGRAPLEGSDDRMLLATLREGSPAPAPSKVMIASAKPFIAGLGQDPPAPPERPLALGGAATRAAHPAGSDVASSARAHAKPAANPPGAYPVQRMEASAAPGPPEIGFAPTRNDREMLGLMSGRGLY
jgi:rare lipoprotein A